MKVLLIGGTGTISGAVASLLSEREEDLTLLNRGSHPGAAPKNGKVIHCDVNDEAAVAAATAGMTFDVVCQFVGFQPEQVERDYRLFSGRTRQYIFISSASAYHKPVADYRITEGTALANPYWAYSRGKIACEEFLMEMYRKNGFPVTIVRPSHTYGERSVPLGVHGKKGSWQVLKRMQEGKPVIIPGDGSSLWTITHCRDFARAFVGLMANPHAIGEAFHITSDEVLTWDQLYAAAANALGVTLKPYHVASEFLAAANPPYDYSGSLVGDKANSVVFDTAKIKRAVPGFAATITAAQGIREAVDYILTHPECQTEDPEFDIWCDRVIRALENAKKTLSGVRNEQEM